MVCVVKKQNYSQIAYWYIKKSAYRLSKDIEIPQTRTSEILKGRRRITADTALRLANYFGNSPQFWLGLQNDFDIEKERNSKEKDFRRIERSKKIHSA